MERSDNVVDNIPEETELEVPSTDATNVLTLEEIANLAAEGAEPEATLMNVVALIAKRFRTDVCSAYLLEPDRANIVLAATVGLCRESIGHLRMAVTEGLTGLVAELVQPIAVWMCSCSLSSLHSFTWMRRQIGGWVSSSVILNW